MFDDVKLIVGGAAIGLLIYFAAFKVPNLEEDLRDTETELVDAKDSVVELELQLNTLRANFDNNEANHEKLLTRYENINNDADELRRQVRDFEIELIRISKGDSFATSVSAHNLLTDVLQRIAGDPPPKNNTDTGDTKDPN